MTYDEMRDYLFREYAPNFNFEKDADELFDLALQRGFIYQLIGAHEEGADPDTYITYKINEEY